MAISEITLDFGTGLDAIRDLAITARGTPVRVSFFVRSRATRRSRVGGSERSGAAASLAQYPFPIREAAGVRWPGRG